MRASSFHHDYYAILGLKTAELANKSEAEIQSTIHMAFRRRALVLHPDKATGNTQKMQELIEARKVLADITLRNHYHHTLKDKLNHEPASKRNPHHASMFFSNTPKPAMKGRVYLATCPLEKIQAAFEQFIKQHLATNAFASKQDFSANIQTDPLTGQQILCLIFPDKKTADQFIAQLLKNGMIKNMHPHASMTTPRHHLSPAIKNTNTPFNFFTPRPKLTPQPTRHKAPETEEAPRNQYKRQ